MKLSLYLRRRKLKFTDLVKSGKWKDVEDFEAWVNKMGLDVDFEVSAFDKPVQPFPHKRKDVVEIDENVETNIPEHPPWRSDPKEKLPEAEEDVQDDEGDEDPFNPLTIVESRKFRSNELKKMKVSALKDILVEKGIDYSGLKKDQLIEKILDEEV